MQDSRDLVEDLSDIEPRNFESDRTDFRLQISLYQMENQ